MESYLHILDGDPLQDIVRSVIQQYKTLVAPKYSEFSKGEYHVQVQISSKFFKKRVNSASYGWDSWKTKKDRYVLVFQRVEQQRNWTEF